MSPVPTKAAKHWGDRLLVLLRRRGMPRVQLANAVGVSAMTVTKWSRGGGIEDDKLVQVCEILGTTPAYLKWGQDHFDDVSWMDGTSEGGEFIRRLMNSSSKHEMLTGAEAALGFVLWHDDADARAWHWSSNAEKLFNMPLASKTSSTIVDQLLAAMSPPDRENVTDLLEGLQAGDVSSGWAVHGLSHMPNVRFMAIARAIPANGGGKRVYGMTISSAGVLGSCILEWGDEWATRNFGRVSWPCSR